MFTGIIEGTGIVKEVQTREECVRLQIEADLTLDSTNVGESVAVNGCCLTITSRLGSCFWADVSPETLAKTTLHQIKIGDPVNLERPLKMGERVGGHIVQGHVDGMGEIVSVENRGEASEVWIAMPATLSRYVVEKGSIAVDGVSLTVNQVEGDRFSVMVIPHTKAKTTFQIFKPHSRVNLEVDIIGKYLEKMHFLNSEQYRDNSSIVREFLKKHGF